MEKRISWSTSKEIVEEPRFDCERFCAHLTGVVKSNSSGMEVWNGSINSSWLKIKRFLIEEWLILGIHLNVD